MIHKNKLIAVGRIISAHSLNGMLKIISYTQNSQDLFKKTNLQLTDMPITITSYKIHQKDIFICKIKGIDNRTDAERIAKSDIFIPKDTLESLADDEFYIEDLKDMPVISLDGKNIGIVADVYNFGAGDIIEIKFNNGSLEMFSFTHQIFPKIDDALTFIPPKIIV
jgi:16S rRNA processing protein RimM